MKGGTFINSDGVYLGVGGRDGFLPPECGRQRTLQDECLVPHSRQEGRLLTRGRRTWEIDKF
jgi:hypothetical protein